MSEKTGYSDEELLKWAQRQRLAYAAGRLTKRQVKMLESVSGWSWGPVRAPDGEEADLVEVDATKTQRPRSCTPHELGRFGVTVVDAASGRLRCMACGTEWSPNLSQGGRMPKGYWRCPNGCNVAINRKGIK